MPSKPALSASPKQEPRLTPPKPWVIALVLAALIGISAIGLVRENQREVQSVTQGLQLFDASADQPLRGRLIGHDEALPIAATRCTNCHVAGPAAKEAATTVLDSNRFGPALNAVWLTQAKQRRGGPPSTYDVKTFCKLLRQGIDPALVLINQTMPNYAITDAQCADVWVYLNRRTS